MYSINRSMGSGTHKLKDRIKNCTILILLDTGSTIPFVNSNLVEKVCLEVVDTIGMVISLVDRSRISYKTMCLGVIWEMSMSNFKFDFKALELGTYELVLREHNGCNVVIQYCLIL